MMARYTGVGSMGAPIKFLSGIHTKSHFALNCFLIIDFVYMHIHVGIRASVYQIIFLATPMRYSMKL